MKRGWLRRLLSCEPHFIIGGRHRPYLLRWYLIPRNRFFNLYLHKFLRDDDDRALHDHPWWFASLILRGGYTEIVRDDSSDVLGYYRCSNCGNDQPFYLQSCANCGRSKRVSVLRRPLSLAFRRAEHRHRVVLHRDLEGNPIPCWTLILTGRKRRTWGFWCPRGFVPWQRFTAPANPGEVGRGCDG